MYSYAPDGHDLNEDAILNHSYWHKETIKDHAFVLKEVMETMDASVLAHRRFLELQFENRGRYESVFLTRQEVVRLMDELEQIYDRMEETEPGDHPMREVDVQEFHGLGEIGED